ncbi:MAG: response regulator [Dehalococcoidia bacterium]|jgi:DNA-binding NtrC family response regulator|nr:response regulator [Dehalococcoidia bacterium]
MTDFANIIIVDDEPAHAGLIEILLDDVAPGSNIAIVDPSDIDSLATRAAFGSQLLIDRRLGSRDALDVVQRLSQDRPDIRVTLMSAFITETDRTEARHAGASAVFEKPMDLDGWRNQLLALVVAGATQQRAA